MKKPQHRRVKPKAKRMARATPSVVGAAEATRRGGRRAAVAVMGHAGRVVAQRSARLSGVLDGGTSRAIRVCGGLVRQARHVVVATTMAPEDRQNATLLLMPFLILAIAMAGNQSVQLRRHLEALIARPVPPAVLPSAQASLRRVAPAPAPITMPLPVPVTTPVGASNSGNVVRLSLADRQPEGVLGVTGFADEPLASQPPRIALAVLPENGRPITARISGLELASTIKPDEVPASRAVDAAGRSEVPLVAGVGHSRIATVSLVPLEMRGLLAYEVGERWRARRVSLDDRCQVSAVEGAVLGRSTPGTDSSPAGAQAMRSGFGERLAAAGRRQLADLVIYDDAYRSISYPLGDVPKLYGVCTDVVIRAYRDLGVDLQVAVQKARVGSGDRNIDHRRTETLRRFFQARGESLPVTSFAEDYLPGDIVTYARPQNTGTSSRSHIAMVSDVIAPSGRPMILHNRGWGPQLEDALFVDQITGHYRYDGGRDVAAAEPSSAGEIDQDHVRLRPVGHRRAPGAGAGKRLTADGPQQHRRTSNALDLSSSGKTAHR